MRKIHFLVIFILLIFFSIFFIRLISPNEIDDVTPGIFCEQEYLEKADVLWVIPKFNNVSITENKEWCEYILSLNKTLGLHGVLHSFEEFKTTRNQSYFNEGIRIFEDCFNQTPTMFKPPQLEINNENKMLIQENNLILKGKLNQFFHKVYHCSNTGTFSNNVIDLF